MEKTKPDLMASTGTRRPTDSKRILAQLEHGVRPAAHPARAAGWTIDGWTIGLFALLLLMCCVAWLMHDKTITPKTFRHSYSSSSSPGVVRRTVENAPVIEQPAAIVNEAAAPVAEVEAVDAVEQPGPTASAAPATVAATTANAAARPGRTVSTPPKPAATVTRAAAAPAGGASPAAGPTGVGSTAPASDTDVTLLTALVAHANKPAAVTPERPRDVVERQEGDTTIQLLARCKQLGLIEGMLCRSRICSGRWEADAACRAPSH